MAETKKPPRRAIALGATALTVLPEATEAVTLARGFKVSVNGLRVDGTPSLAACEKVGTTLLVLERGAQFSIGDFANYVEERFGEAASQIIDASSGWSLKTTSVYRWLAARIAPDVRRMDRLGVRHHLAVAALPPAKQRKWLTDAAADGEDEPWTVARLNEALKADEDVPPSAWFVVVACPTAARQTEVMAQLEAEGLTCKASVKYGKKALTP